MPTKHKTDSKEFYKPDKEEQTEKTRWTFITPFVSASMLALPSLIVLAYGKQTVAFKTVVESGVYSLALAFLWFLVPLAVISGVLYVVRGSSRAAKAMVVITAVLLLASFVYVIWPQ